MQDQLELWEVFTQSKPGQPYRHAGNVHASDRQMAIENARDAYLRRGETSGLWVVRSSAIIAVPVEEAHAYFDPNDDKIYRHPSFYVMPEGAKNI
jgi:ring-1,2-phenylacetyl-CoA epoxidase subunit PaaB